MAGVFYVPLRKHGGGKESAHKVNSGEKNSPAGIRAHNLSVKRPALYQEAIPVIDIAEPFTLEPFPRTARLGSARAGAFTSAI